MRPDFSAMTTKELKTYAKENNIDLGDSKKKEDIIIKINNYYEEDNHMEENQVLNNEMENNTEVNNSEVGNTGAAATTETTGTTEDKRVWKDAAGNEVSMSQFIREQFLKNNKSRKAISDEFKINYRTVYGATVNMENAAEPASRGRGVVNPKINVTADNKVLTQVDVPAVEAAEGVEAKEAYTKYFLNGEEIVANEAGEIVIPETVETDRNTWIKDQVAAGANRGDIAKALDLSYGVVYGLTKEEDGTRQKYEVALEDGTKMARSEYIRKRVNEGVSKSDVAKELGVEYSVVWQATKKEKSDADKLAETIDTLSKFADKMENKEGFLAAVEAIKVHKVVEETPADATATAATDETAAPADEATQA